MARSLLLLKFGIADIIEPKLRKARQVLKGWNFNYEGYFRRNKKFISDQIEEIDKRSEFIVLSLHDYNNSNSLQKAYRVMVKIKVTSIINRKVRKIIKLLTLNLTDRLTYLTRLTEANSATSTGRKPEIFT